MITNSPTLAAMGLGVRAVERHKDFDQAVMRLQRAREEAARLQRIRERARGDAARDGEGDEA